MTLVAAAREPPNDRSRGVQAKVLAVHQWVAVLLIVGPALGVVSDWVATLVAGSAAMNEWVAMVGTARSAERTAAVRKSA